MDNLENYLYILFAVIYIISRIIKARSKQQQQKAQPPQQREVQQAGRARQQQEHPQRKKAFSFDDILKEFEKNLTGEEELADEKPLPVQEIKHEKPVPVVQAPVERKRNPYESYEGSDFKSVKRDIDLEDKSVFGRSENYSIKANIASEYVKMLKEPQGFKNAIVLSEIINRKYF